MRDSLVFHVHTPSIATVRHQAAHLTRALQSINSTDYPPEAFQLRSLFLCATDYIVELLDHMSDTASSDPDVDIRLRDLAKLIQDFYSYMRYLRASTPTQSPPAVRLALNLLTQTYRTPQLAHALLLVRPQWKYNLEHVSITRELRKNVPISAIDPDQSLGVTTPDELLQSLWRWWRARLATAEQNEVPLDAPEQVAILSFSGLAADDPFFLPLLAHELGHYFDSSYERYLSAEIIKGRAEISTEAIIAKLDGALPEGQDSVHDAGELKRWKMELQKRVYRCVQELLADSLETRMMGLAFFAAHSENLKTISQWPEPMILRTGYPGFKFRLQQVLKQLISHNSLLAFASTPAPSGHEDDQKVLWDYLAAWTARLEGDEYDTDQVVMSATEYRLHELVMESVARTLEAVSQTADMVIDSTICAQLTNRVYDRIALLQDDLPPVLETESHEALSELLAAAWIYRLKTSVYPQASTRKVAVDSYTKLCRLMLKALELLPLLQRSSDPPAPIHVASVPLDPTAGVLSQREINSRTDAALGDPRRIAIVPLRRKAIQSSSVDLRLGNWFSVFRRTKVRSVPLDPTMESELLKSAAREDIFVPFGRDFLVHPGDFVLGVTLEFVALPNDIAGWVEGRSRPGRMGLSVATATHVAPGFHGVLVL